MTQTGLSGIQTFLKTTMYACLLDMTFDGSSMPHNFLDATMFKSQPPELMDALFSILPLKK
jgi:hypothetical protein